MRKILTIISFLLLLIGSETKGQALKPTIMVIPSDAWCIRNGYYSEVNIDGTTTRVMDYQRAMQENSDIRAMISKMGNIMADRQFPLESMEQRLKDISTDKAFVSLIQSKESGSSVQESELDILNRIAKPDIILDLDYNIKRIAGNRQISFNLTAIDAYSKKIISGITGVGKVYSSAQTAIELQLNEAVNNYMPSFTTYLTNYFNNDIGVNGRIIEVNMLVFDGSAVDFETEFDYNGEIAELADILYVWFEENTVKGRFSERSRTSTSIVYNDVRMPLRGKSLSGKETAMSASNYVNGLIKVLRGYDIPAKKIVRGQGNVTIVIGEK